MKYASYFANIAQTSIKEIKEKAKTDFEALLPKLEIKIEEEALKGECEYIFVTMLGCLYGYPLNEPYFAQQFVTGLKKLGYGCSVTKDSEGILVAKVSWFQ